MIEDMVAGEHQPFVAAIAVAEACARGEATKADMEAAQGQLPTASSTSRTLIDAGRFEEARRTGARLAARATCE